MRNLALSILVIFMLPSYASAAGHVLDAKITTLYCGYVGTYEMCSLTFDKPITDKDICHTGGSERMQFKPDTDIGKTMLSIALAAHVSQKIVNVYSTGSCSIFSGFADVNWITIKQ